MNRWPLPTQAVGCPCIRKAESAKLPGVPMAHPVQVCVCCLPAHVDVRKQNWNPAGRAWELCMLGKLSQMFTKNLIMTKEKKRKEGWKTIFYRNHEWPRVHCITTAPHGGHLGWCPGTSDRSLVVQALRGAGQAGQGSNADGFSDGNLPPQVEDLSWIPSCSLAPAQPWLLQAFRKLCLCLPKFLKLKCQTLVFWTHMTKFSFYVTEVTSGKLNILWL